jgi:hypothetical protein
MPRLCSWLTINSPVGTEIVYRKPSSSLSTIVKIAASMIAAKKRGRLEQFILIYLAAIARCSGVDLGKCLTDVTHEEPWAHTSYSTHIDKTSQHPLLSYADVVVVQVRTQ